VLQRQHHNPGMVEIATSTHLPVAQISTVGPQRSPVFHAGIKFALTAHIAFIHKVNAIETLFGEAHAPFRCT